MPGETFTSVRTTKPDYAALLKQLRGLDATAGLVITDAQHYYVKKNTAWTAGQRTTVQGLIDTAVPETPQTLAQAYVDALPLEEKAWKIIEVEEFNRLRAALTGLGVLTLPPLTLDAVLTAWRNKAGEIS